MSIKNLGRQYNQFQHRFGSGMAPDEEIMNALFSPQFKKIANGSVLVSERSMLKSQLDSVREFAGNWQIHEKEIIPSADNSKCTLRYILSSEKAGQFDVIAILSSHNGHHIDTIDEVYYLIES